MENLSVNQSNMGNVSGGEKTQIQTQPNKKGVQSLQESDITSI